MKIRCVAIDDEPLAIEIIEDYISKVPFLSHLKSFDNAIDFIEFMKIEKVDLIFLDIEMEGLSGIQLLSVMKDKPQVILTTAYDSYAIESYKFNVTDYLLKPISFERFIIAVDKAYDNLADKKTFKKIDSEINIVSSKEKFFFVKTENRLQKILFDDILFIEGQGDYLRITCAEEKIMTLQNFKQLEEALPENNFVRVHKSFMISIDKIENIERNRIKIGEQLIPISDTYKKHFYAVLNERKLL